MLKSIWLEGKRNWRMDHQIHTLIMKFLLDLEIHHEQQMLRMKGLNLAEKHCWQILTRATKTPLNKIQKIDDSHFKVQSLNTNRYYNIDLVTTTCDCSNFLHICLCKHIAGIVHFLRRADLRPRPPGNRDGTSESSESVTPKSLAQKDSSLHSANDIASFISTINEIIRLTQQLIFNAPSDLGITNCSQGLLIQCDLDSMPWCSQQWQRQITIPTS